MPDLYTCTTCAKVNYSNAGDKIRLTYNCISCKHPVHPAMMGCSTKSGENEEGRPLQRMRGSLRYYCCCNIHNIQYSCYCCCNDCVVGPS